jgi:DNA polymerase III gamma/tau subunit
MKRIALLLGSVVALAACTSQEPAKPTPPPALPKPAPVAEAPKPEAPKAGDAGTPDAKPLGMMEKYALWKAQKEADEKLAKELAEQESARLRKFDKTKLPVHQKLLAFEKKTRKDLDDAAEKLKGQSDAGAQMEKVAEKLRKPIEAQAKILRKMDPSGGNSNIGTDHDVVLNALANDYPAALAAAAAGDEKPLAEVRKEVDRRFDKMDKWLEEVKTSSDAKPGQEAKPAHAGKPGKAAKKGKKK